jgi:hypothetical protein
VKEDDLWDEVEFKETEVETRFGTTEMKLKEKETVISKYPMREIRRLSSNGHQTSIVTTNKILTVSAVAAGMFGRWVQENFFRYFRQEYSFDRIIQYTIDDIDNNVTVVNRESVKKKREQLSRRKADLYDHRLNSPPEEKIEPVSKKMSNWIIKQFEIQENIQRIEDEIEKLIEKRQAIPYKIAIGQMSSDNRYVKLHQESKYFMNIIKMICYRAETAIADLLANNYRRSDDEIRALVKAITKQPADIIPDYINDTLSVTIYPLANNRSQFALANLVETVNNTHTKYPETDLTMIFKIATV